MKIDRVPIPTHDRHKTYRESVKGKARDIRRNSKRETDHLTAYLSKPFIGWDGEGINEPDGSHTYVLLANSLGQSIHNRNGLSTVECFEFLLSAANAGGNNVIYGGSYDFNMMMRDIPREHLEQIYRFPNHRWNGYRISWRHGKMITLSNRGRTITLWDVLPFFQRTFVQACDEYLGDSWESREQIITEKANRGTFDYDRIADVIEYNKAELRNLVALCDELRARFWKVDIRVKRWDGPGAIAAELFRANGVKKCIADVPEQVAEASRYAYAGGRFEIIRKGHSETGAYQYDINSAYPAAMRYLPCLAHGKWITVYKPTEIAPFGIYLINRAMPDDYFGRETRPHPLWIRNPNSTILYAQSGINWHWSPEAELGLEAGYEIEKGFEYSTDCDCNPFAFIEPLFNKRRALKRANDGAHVGIKLGLNSLYGKMAQQVGWRRNEDGSLRIPPYHCLPWAGFVTAYCRAQVYRAATLAIDDVIAFETDAIFSRVPLTLNIGSGLGQWEATEYASLTYLKSGMYWATTRDGDETKAKTRGFGASSIDRRTVIEALASEEDTGKSVELSAPQTRFQGLGLSLVQDFAKWTHWVTADRRMSTRLTGKRVDHLRCPPWPDGKLLDDGWSETITGFDRDWEKVGDMSTAFAVEWINPNPLADQVTNMSIMEMRLERGESEWQIGEQ